MKQFLFLLFASAASAASPNVLLLCIDDLRPELACYGVGYIHSPNIDDLAARSRVFDRHYVQAPTCGASRYTLLTGTYGMAGNDAIFKRARTITGDTPPASPTLPAWFRKHGYTTVSIGKVSHHPGGLGGKDWDDPAQPEMPLSWDRNLMPSGAWQHPRGVMHGLANGHIRTDPGKMPVMESFDGPDSAYPDGLTTAAALDQLDLLATADSPFFLAVGIIRPHLPFGAPAKYMPPYTDADLPPVPHPDKPHGTTTWHGSGEFMKYDRGGRDPRTDPDFATELRKHYAACVTYADAQVGIILSKLQELGLEEDTVIVLWGDHGWHLGEHSVWGKHTLFEESLRSPLMIHYPGISNPGTHTAAVVETIDLFPTLCDLAQLRTPSTLHGTSLAPQLSDPSVPGRSAVSYHRGASTIRTPTHRLVAHSGGALELYDHTTPQAESVNLASSNPKLAASLRESLDQRLELSTPKTE